MKEILINVSKETRMVDLNKSVIGNDGENLQGKLVFTFVDEFVNGQARLEYEIKGNKNYMLLDKESETYTIPVKNVITKEGQIDMQLVITEGTDEEEIPVFKSNKFYLFCNSSINAVSEAPDGYELWIEKANTKLNELDNVDIDIQDNVVTITKKDGTTKSENVKGDDYVITEEDYNEIETNVKSDIQPILDEAKEKSETAISISKGANQALSYDNYEKMIMNFNAFEREKFNLGQQVMIKTLNVPDLWVYNYANENIEYSYVNDETFVNALKEKGYVQIGWYLLAELETQKVDLTDYVKNTDYATSSKAGVVKTNLNGGIDISTDGQLRTNKATNAEIVAKTNQYKPIVPSNLDHAIKSGLTANSLEWTKEEKKNARELLGLEKKYEYIETITIEEEGIKTILHNTEPNGTPYNFKALLIKATIEPGTVAGQVNIYTRKVVGDGSSGSALTLYSNNTIYVDKKYYLQFESYSRYGRWMGEYTGATSIYGSAIYKQNYRNELFPDDTIKEIYSLVTTANVEFPVGSKFEIYGVRA